MGLTRGGGERNLFYFYNTITTRGVPPYQKRASA